MTTSKIRQSLDDRIAYLNTPAGWDYLYRCGAQGEPMLQLSFAGDPHAWSQLKDQAVVQGVDPIELLRLALYQFLDRPGHSAATRARFLAHREWERTRPVYVSDEKGPRWIPADRLSFELK